MSESFMYRLCRNALLWIALILTAGIFLLNVFYFSEISASADELVIISGSLFPSILMLIITLLVVFVLKYIRGILESLEENKLFRILALVYSVFAAYLIFNVDNIIRADAKIVFTAALEVKEGFYSIFQPGQYIYRYPHQLGLMLYDQILTIFSENPQFVFFINFLLVLGINHTSWKISDTLFHDRFTNVLTILLSFAFLPQLFFILFAYGLIPGFFFLMFGFYQCLKYLQTKKWRHMVGMLAGIAVAVLLKQNFLIGGIAILIVLFLDVLKEKRYRLFGVMAALLVCLAMPAGFLKLWYGNLVEVKLDNPCPSVLWIAMGTDIDNDRYGCGWYDGSNWNLYDASGYDTEIASALGREKLRSNIEKMMAEPSRTRKYFINKTISQWCDPMYQSVWSGPLEDCGQNTHTDILKSLYTGGAWADRIATCMKFLCLFLWLFAATYLLRQGKKENGWELMYLYFIGGLLFHTFWEAKSQYTYPYLFVLIPFAAAALKKFVHTEIHK